MKIKKVFCVIGILSGIAAIIMGSMLNGLSIGNSASSYLSSAEFGADFYTYVYKGIKEAAENTELTADNVHALADVVKTGLSYVLIALGLLQVSIFGVKLGSVQAEEEKQINISSKAQQIIEKLDSFSSSLNRLPDNNRESQPVKDTADELPPL